MQQRAENRLHHGLDGLVLEIEGDLAFGRGLAVDRFARDLFIDELAAAGLDLGLGGLVRLVLGLDLDRRLVIDLLLRQMRLRRAGRGHFAIEIAVAAERGAPGQHGGQRCNQEKRWA
ncbi:MAG: hypothetical protein ACYC9P_12945 [Rudaea sp.]